MTTDIFKIRFSFGYDYGPVSFKKMKTIKPYKKKLPVSEKKTADLLFNDWQSLKSILINASIMLNARPQTKIVNGNLTFLCDFNILAN